MLLLLGGMVERGGDGRINLTVEFLVRDAESGQPIEGANVVVENWGKRIEDQGEKEVKLQLERDTPTRRDFVEPTQVFELQTGHDGVAAKVAPKTPYSLSIRWYGLWVTDSVGMPEWRVAVTAKGYTPCETFLLSSHPACLTAHRTGPGQSKVVFPITMRKLQ
jgi:hypothetical protein